LADFVAEIGVQTARDGWCSGRIGWRDELRRHFGGSAETLDEIPDPSLHSIFFL